MKTHVVKLEMDHNLGDVKDIFENTHFHHLLITEGGTLVGIVSDRDFLKSVSPHADTYVATDKENTALKRHVHTIMSRSLITLGQDADIFDAVDVFCNNKISCIPIIDDRQHILGVLSWRDIMAVLHERKLAKSKA
jgi:acetoin utilization protein AcuB